MRDACERDHHHPISRQKGTPHTMHPVKEFAVGGAACLALLGAGYVAEQALSEYVASDPPATITTPAPVTMDIGLGRCAEDDPCWSWSTMGNRRRGVTLRDGTRRVVGPCGFATLVVGGLVDRQHDPMRGDAWAMAHGCANGPAVHPSGVVEVR